MKEIFRRIKSLEAAFSTFSDDLLTGLIIGMGVGILICVIAARLHS